MQRLNNKCIFSGTYLSIKATLELMYKSKVLADSNDASKESVSVWFFFYGSDIVFF